MVMGGKLKTAEDEEVKKLAWHLPERNEENNEKP
jgi:hypothetical protein